MLEILRDTDESVNTDKMLRSNEPLAHATAMHIDNIFVNIIKKGRE
jgi:hypothetical protein